MTQPRIASLCDINRILGVSGSTDPLRPNSVQVTGINPQRITVGDLTVTQKFNMLGSFESKITLPAGTAADPSIKFVGASAGTGIYSPVDGGVSFAVGGDDIVSFASDGIHTNNIYSPSGVIDFHNSTVVNVAGWAQSQWAYTLVSPDIFTTTDDTPGILLDIPVVPVNQDYEVTLNIRTHVTAVYNTTETQVFDATFTNILSRQYSYDLEDYEIYISEAFDQTIYSSPDNVFSIGASLVVRNADMVRLSVTGLAQMSINWMGSCKIQRTETEPPPEPEPK